MTHPGIGIWLNDDGTISAPDPSNPYRYVGNDPTNGVDPSGLAGLGVAHGCIKWVEPSPPWRPLPFYPLLTKPRELTQKEITKLKEDFPNFKAQGVVVLAEGAETTQVEHNCFADGFKVPGVIDVSHLPEGFQYKDPKRPEFKKAKPTFFKQDLLDQLMAFYGYKKSADGKLVPGQQKIAVFAYSEDDGQIISVKHFARQTEDGSWISKIGDGLLIRHPTLDILEEGKAAGLYGKVVAYYEKAR